MKQLWLTGRSASVRRAIMPIAGGPAFTPAGGRASPVRSRLFCRITGGEADITDGGGGEAAHGARRFQTHSGASRGDPRRHAFRLRRPPPTRNVRFTYDTSRPVSANSGHSRTPWGTGNIEPELPFKGDGMNRREARESGRRPTAVLTLQRIVLSMAGQMSAGHG